MPAKFCTLTHSLGMKRCACALHLLRVITWFFSFVYHARDIGYTELVDYFFADFMWWFTSAWSIIAAFQLKKRSEQITVCTVFGIWLFIHFLYLVCLFFPGIALQPQVYWKFDYGMNTAMGTVNGIIQSMIWVHWAFRNPDRCVGRVTILNSDKI